MFLQQNSMLQYLHLHHHQVMDQILIRLQGSLPILGKILLVML